MLYNNFSLDSSLYFVDIIKDCNIYNFLKINLKRNLK